ncbi:MAG TPA: nuclear transport factor 2 family protein [Stellaceae bacterium]|nr:nuclear transport factor 2 family protein [Stellaceae bacterium]
MNEFTDLIDRYIAAWNETDGERRRALIARTFTDRASYLDPLMAGDGAAAIDGMIAAVQQRFPGYRFRRKGEVDAHHDRIRFGWELAPEGGLVFVDGTDFATIADGRLDVVTGFLDRQPGAAG